MEKITINGVEYKLTPIENETVNKAEPKFKVGDWVVLSTSDGEKVVQIDSIEYFKSGEPRYITSEGRWFGNGTKAHLWTIEDAKDGDAIFYDDGWTCIFKYIHGIWYSSYCFITADGEFHTGYERHAVDSTINGNANPATKEQRNLLFTKMKEAGYEWDAEKKELKKIELKPTEWSEEDKRMFDYALDMIEWYSGKNEDKSRLVSDWLKSLKDRVFSQPKQEWSEEDELKRSTLIHVVKKQKGSAIFEGLLPEELINWLKAIKQRIGG